MIDLKIACPEYGILVISHDLRLVGMNPHARRLLNIDQSSIGKNLFADRRLKTFFKQDTGRPGHEGTYRQRPAPLNIVTVSGKTLVIVNSDIKVQSFGGQSIFVMTIVDIVEQIRAVNREVARRRKVRRVCVHHNNSSYLIDMDTVFFIRSEGNYCRLYTSEGNFFVRKTLKDFLLADERNRLISVHKSYVVNLEHVYRLTRNGGGTMVIEFRAPGLPPVPVAKRKVSLFRDALKKLG